MSIGTLSRQNAWCTWGVQLVPVPLDDIRSTNKVLILFAFFHRRLKRLTGRKSSGLLGACVYDKPRGPSGKGKVFPKLI